MATLLSNAAAHIAAAFCASQQPAAPIDVGGYVAASGDAEAVQTCELAGIADPENARAVDQDTVFHVASLSKQITAAALAMAITEGKLSLDDPLANYVPEAAHYGDDLLLAHLVYFTSGLTEAYDLPRDGGLPWTTHYYFSVEEAIAKSLSVPDLAFEPGSQWRYNNINYQLIAEVVERVYGEPFSNVVADKIFAPLGMTASSINDDITAIIKNRANGMVARSPDTVAQFGAIGIEVAPEGGPILIRRNAPHYGGSGVMTSMEDWAKWQAEMLSQQTFGEAFWTLMFSTRAFDHDKANDAFGLVHSELDGEPILWFAGGDIDAASYMLISPESGRWSACFSNNPMFDCRERAEHLLRQ